MLWEHDVAGSNPVIPTKKEKIALAVVFSFLLFSYSPFVNIELTKKMFLINSFYLILISKRDII